MGKNHISKTRKRREDVREAIERVKIVAQKSKKGRRRFASYRYLRAVLRCYSELEDKRLLKTLKLVLDREYGIPRSRELHAIRRIIEATAPFGDTKMRSRWTRALHFAWNEEVKPKELRWFFEQNSGIAGCARRCARALATRPLVGWDDDEIDIDEEYCPPRWEKEEWDKMKDDR